MFEIATLLTGTNNFLRICDDTDLQLGTKLRLQALISITASLFLEDCRWLLAFQIWLSIKSFARLALFSLLFKKT